MGDFYEEQRFPDEFRVGSSIGLQFDVDVVVAGRASPSISRIKRSPYPMKTFNMSRISPTAALLKEFQDWLYAMAGPYTGFRIRDFSDYKSCQLDKQPRFSDQFLGIGDNIKTDFQLVKEYGLPGRLVRKPVLKPVLNSVSIGAGGAQSIVDIDYTVDHTTGMVIFDTPPNINVIVTAGFLYDTPVIFQDVDMDGISVIAQTVLEVRSLRFLELLNP